MGNIMKKSQFVILLIVWGLMICGCSTNNDGAKKEQIKEDIETSEYLSQYGLEVYDINIEKRKTDRGNKIDSIFVSVNSKNEDIDYLCKLELNYTLYNEGWLLDNILPYQEEEWCISPFKDVSNEDIENAIKRRYTGPYNVDIPSFKRIDEYHTIITKNGKIGNEVTYIYEFTKEHPYLTSISTEEIKFEFFVGDTDWTANEKDDHLVIDYVQNWNINGTWEYTNSNDFSAKITINNYDGKTIDCTYDIDCHGKRIDERFYVQNTGVYEVKEIQLDNVDRMNYYTGKEEYSNNYGTGFYVIFENGTSSVGDGSVYFTFDQEKGVIISAPYFVGDIPMTKTN